MGGLFDNTLEGFERSQGYQAVTTDPLGIQTSYRKPVIERAEIVGHVQIDACTYEQDTAAFHEDPEKRLPYALCADPAHLSRLRLDARREARVPRKPLLLLYKLKALRDRRHDLDTKGPILSAERRNWLRDKWTKDGADLIALLDPHPPSPMIPQGLDARLLSRIVEAHALQFALDSLTQLPEMQEALDLYGNATPEQAADWISRALK